ncbi:MAG: hypothetical protein IJV07_00740 [Alphaproteobacteria bacterium]|nr:hypothetical protein [Alphaproteobacteria bacterium]
MISRFLKLIFHTLFYVVLFFGLVWALMGIPPQDAWQRMSDHLSRLSGQGGTFVHNMANTASDMKEAADSQLQQASDRFHGKDPYEGYAKRLDKSMF